MTMTSARTITQWTARCEPNHPCPQVQQERARLEGISNCTSQRVARTNGLWTRRPTGNGYTNPLQSAIRVNDPSLGTGLGINDTTQTGYAQGSRMIQVRLAVDEPKASESPNP